jgi:hypothetical protein
MKRLCLGILILLSVNLVFAAKLGTLLEILKPDLFEISDDDIYILEGATISIYSLKDLSLKTKFGQKGEGPGEIKLSDYYINKIFIYPDHILVDSLGKILFFSKKGRLIKETKKTLNLIMQLAPVGKNFVIKRLDRTDGKVEFVTLGVYDSKMKLIKEIYRQISPIQVGKTDMIPDGLFFCVIDDKIFVEESTRGFFIEVFDHQGKKLYQIEKDYEKVKVTEKDKEEVMRLYKMDPWVRHMGFENVKKIIKFNFFDSYPAIQGIRPYGEKIVVRTFRKVENKEEFIIMDLKGQELKKIYMPPVEIAPNFAENNGIDIQLYTIYKNKFYYLRDNQDDETWELHAEEIK